MNYELIQKKADHLRAIPLREVLRAWGATPDLHDPHKWHTAQGAISITGAKFMNWNRGVGGGGAIDLVIHLTHLGFKEALDWLAHHFPNPSSQTASVPAEVPLNLPPPQPAQLGRVRHYLLHHRHLPAATVDSLIQNGSLYADHRANAVFLLLGEKKIPVGAELRGTDPQHPWRGMAPGSKKDRGFFSVPAVPAEAIVLCESAIDAISCFALRPQFRCISTAGARPNPCWLPGLLDHGHRVYCGFDTDQVGENMARAMIALFPAVQRLAPPFHDWNDTVRSHA